MAKHWAIAEWDYVATHEDELSFRKGDHILIQDSSHEEWWEGDCNGFSGVFPANRCRLLSVLEDETLEQSAQGQDQHYQDQKISPDALYHHDVLGHQTLDQFQSGNERDRDVSRESNDIARQLSGLQSHQNPSSYTIMTPQLDHATDTTQIQSPPPEPTDGLSDGEQVVLPANWSATTNAKGRLYYYNVVTKETSWKLPAASAKPSTTEEGLSYVESNKSHTSSALSGNTQAEVFSQGYTVDDEPLPEGWNSAQDEAGSQYFFNASTGETTWDRPMSPEAQRHEFQSPTLSESSVGLSESSPGLPEYSRAHTTMSPTVPRTTPKRQSSVDENMLQSQLLSLSLSEEELRALELSQLPLENILRRGSLRVKSQKVSTNATISSWKDYWVVVYKGFLLFYRDESGAIKSAYSLKSSAESMTKLKQATQVKPSGCFDADKIAVELPGSGQVLTKKKNFFYITPGTSVRMLLQDASGGDEKAWVKDIKSSLESRRADELTGMEEPYLIQILKRQTSGGADGSSGLKMNKKIEEKELKTINKNPLKMDKARGIRSMVAQGMHVPRRKSAQDEKLKLPSEDDIHHYHNEAVHSDSYPRHPVASATAPPALPGTAGASASVAPSRPFSNPKRKTSRDQNKENESATDGHFTTEAGQDVGSPGSNSLSHHGAKAKLSNMSRSFFSKDRESKDREKERKEDRLKDKGKDKFKDKYKDKDAKKELPNAKASLGGSTVFGGSLEIETGRTVPKVVELCIRTIEERGLSTAGIYRVSGHMASIQNLKRAFNDGASDVQKLIEKEPDVNTIAALLKLYFRELREPLLLYDFYPSFIAAAEISDYNEKLYTIKSLVHSLPESNFNTLQYLMTHLGRVQDQYHTTKMDSANLAICFAPNLLRQEVDDLTSIINTGKQSSIIDTLIEQREWVFDPYPEEDDDEEGETAATETVLEEEEVPQGHQPQHEFEHELQPAHEPFEAECIQQDTARLATQEEGAFQLLDETIGVTGPPPPFMESDNSLHHYPVEKLRQGDYKGPLDPS